MSHIHVVKTGETVKDISSANLQTLLAGSPDCVLVPGSCEDLWPRFQELGMFSFRGSGNGFEGEGTTFRQIICIKDIVAGGQPFVRMGRGNSSKFDNIVISQGDMEAAVNL